MWNSRSSLPTVLWADYCWNSDFSNASTLGHCQWQRFSLRNLNDINGFCFIFIKWTVPRVLKRTYHWIFWLGLHQSKAINHYHNRDMVSICDHVDDFVVLSHLMPKIMSQLSNRLRSYVELYSFLKLNETKHSEWDHWIKKWVEWKEEKVNKEKITKQKVLKLSARTFLCQNPVNLSINYVLLIYEKSHGIRTYSVAYTDIAVIEGESMVECMPKSQNEHSNT